MVFQDIACSLVRQVVSAVTIRTFPLTDTQALTVVVEVDADAHVTAVVDAATTASPITIAAVR